LASAERNFLPISPTTSYSYIAASGLNIESQKDIDLLSLAASRTPRCYRRRKILLQNCRGWVEIRYSSDLVQRKAAIHGLKTSVTIKVRHLVAPFIFFSGFET
jgi:hypothetical protein